MDKKFSLVKKLHNKNLTWSEIADEVNKRFGEATNGGALRKWFSYHKDRDLVAEKKRDTEHHAGKKALIKEVLSIVRSKGGRITLDELEKAGVSASRARPYFPSLKTLVQELHVSHPAIFKLVETHVDHSALAKAIDKASTVVVTTVVTGALADTKIVKTLTKYCETHNAIVVYIPVSDPASNIYTPYTTKNVAHTVDKRIADNPYFHMAHGRHIKLANKLFIANIKTQAKQADPTTGLARIANKLGSIVIGSPKQRLVSVPTSNVKLPRFLMTTGCITKPDYSTDNYVALRTAFLSQADHVMGAIVIDKTKNGLFHFRQIQFGPGGRFQDLGTRYTSTKPPEQQSIDALVMGDWHSGSTDPKVVRAIKEMCKEFNPKYLVVHDGFDGLSINHHEQKNRVIKAKRAASKQNNLLAEVIGYAKDLNMLAQWAGNVVICKSNHDMFLDRYLAEARYLEDPENHTYALSLAQVMAEGGDPLKYAVQNCGVELPDNIIWLSRDDDFKVNGIQLAAHGDQGPNGARGTLRNIEASYGKCVIGHSHTPGILRDAWQVGTSTYLNLEYTSGPSSWLQTACLINKDGGRQLVNIILGRWRR